ncbi:MAG: TonB family protein [Mariprofundaceae bacterium]|nr:TonB family protein [Mariprofundaceae bacterium]
MYAYIVTIDSYRQQSQRKQAYRLLWALCMALLIHLLLIQVAVPIEKHDSPPVHRVSPMDIEMIVSPAPVKQVIKQVEPQQKAVIPSIIKPVPVMKPKAVIRKKAVMVHLQKKPIMKQKSIIKQSVEFSANKPIKQRPPIVNTARSSMLTKNQPYKVRHPIDINIQVLRNQYIADVMHTIKTHKLYPYLARRRHLEGDVLISFVIDARGKAKDIQINGKHSVLQRASRAAIKASQPFSVAPKGLGAMIRVTFVMQYRLRQ